LFPFSYGNTFYPGQVRPNLVTFLTSSQSHFPTTTNQQAECHTFTSQWKCRHVIKPDPTTDGTASIETRSVNFTSSAADRQLFRAVDALFGEQKIFFLWEIEITVYE